MKKTIIILAFAMAAMFCVLLTGCGSSGSGEDLSDSEYVGTWKAVSMSMGDEKESVDLSLTFPVECDSVALLELVDGENCNPLACWHAMGEPADLTEEQLTFLRAAGQPARKALVPEKKKEGTAVSLTLAPNALARLRLLPVTRSSDPGYDYTWYAE